MTSNHVLWFIAAIFVFFAAVIARLWSISRPKPRPIGQQCLLLLTHACLLVSTVSIIWIGIVMFKAVYHVGSDPMSEPDTLQITGR